MSGTVWSKFFWSDWDNDPKLKLCSFAAQGLWMRFLCIAAQHDPIGYVSTTGDPLSVTDLARLTGASETEVETLVAELERNGVFSRDRRGRIYSRRMVADAKASAEARKNGKLGGNPNLGKGEGNRPGVNPPHKARLKPQKPSASTKVEPKGSNLSGAEASASPRGGRAEHRAECPADLREAVVAKLGEDYAKSYLDRARWQDLPVRALVCRLGLTAKQLQRDCRRELAAAGVVVLTEEQARAAA
jgi:biotin operon repressor